MKNIKKIFAMLLILALAFSVVSCGAPSESGGEGTSTGGNSESVADSTGDDEKEDVSTASGGIIRMGVSALEPQMANLSPFATGNLVTLLDILYETVFYFNPKSGEIMPALANDYTWDEGKENLTITINEEAKWHDGTAVTADDIVYTMQIMKDNPEFDRNAMWDKLSSVTADGNTVTFATNSPYISLPEYLTTVKIVPKHIWENEDAATFTNNTPVGSGPFVFDKYTTGTSIELNAFDDYFRGRPNVDEMIIIMYNGTPNSTLALLSGDLDMTDGGVAMSSLPEFQTKEGAMLDVFAGPGNFSVVINHENELLADVAVRQAMAMAINQPELVTKGEYDGVLPTSIAWIPAMFGEQLNEEAANSLTFDLEGAAKVLEDAGYVKGSDGVYAKDGKRLSFTYHNASGAPAQQMEAGMIQQWLLNLGIEIIPKLATWPELTALAQTGDYDLLQMGINFPPDAFAALNSCFNSELTAPTGETVQGLNYFRYRSDEMDNLLALASQERDEEMLTQYYHDMQDILASDYVFLPMYNSSGHIPYYDGVALTNWPTDVPTDSNIALASVKSVG